MNVIKLITLLIGVFWCLVAIVILFPVVCIGRWFIYMSEQIYDLMSKMMREGDKIMDN